MHTLVMHAMVDSCFQISAALVIIMLQRWLLLLSTPEKDWAWVKRTELYQAYQNARWYRGWEYYHQINASRILGL